jgi:Ca2+-binding RTX toxin-like protein
MFTYASFENLVGGTQSDTFIISNSSQISGNLHGAGGVDTLLYSTNANRTVNLQTLSASSVGGVLNSIDTIVFGSGIDTVIGRNANTSWSLNGNQTMSVTGISFQSVENLVGGTGIDTLNGPNLTNTWNLTGSDSGNTLAMFWQGMERLNGAGQSDVFMILPGATMSGRIDGNGGIDTLSYGDYGSSVTVNLATSSSTGIPDFASIAMLVGSSSVDVLIGANNANIWTVTTSSAGNVDGTSFEEFESLQGGSASDTYRVTAGVVFAGGIDGLGGIDELDYGTHTLPVDVNLHAGTATGFVALFGIENITGGDGNDLLVGNAGDNVISGGNGDDIILGWGGNDTLNGNVGRDLLIGGTGADVIHGNNNEDIVIGGRWSYADDTSGTLSQTALEAVMAEWRRTDIALNARIDHLNGNVGGGLNGPYLFNGSTVLDDGSVDDLFGDTGTDWFLAFVTDQVHSGSGDIWTAL